MTDPSRLTSAWYEAVRGEGLSDAEYIEIVGVTTQVLSIDDFHRGLGAALEALPEPQAGEPSRRRPVNARVRDAWVPMVEPDALDPEERDLYGGARYAANIQKALSLVPAEVRALGDLHGAHYFSFEEVGRLDQVRSLDRAQIELVAARVSAINECFY